MQLSSLELSTPENGNVRRQRKWIAGQMKSLFICIVFVGMAAAQNPSAIRSLKSIQKIYVDKMPDGLDRCIRAEITKQFKGKLAVVLRPEDADAIMAAVDVQKTGLGQMTTDRRVSLHDMATGSISVFDREGQRVLWSSEVHDRGIWWGATRRGGAQKVAGRLVHNLKTAIEQ